MTDQESGAKKQALNKELKNLYKARRRLQMINPVLVQSDRIVVFTKSLSKATVKELRECITEKLDEIRKRRDEEIGKEITTVELKMGRLLHSK